MIHKTCELDYNTNRTLVSDEPKLLSLSTKRCMLQLRYNDWALMLLNLCQSDSQMCHKGRLDKMVRGLAC